MNTFQQTISGNQPPLVDFYAPWCGPCKAMHPVLEQLQKECKHPVNILKVDIEQHPELQRSIVYSPCPP